MTARAESQFDLNYRLDDVPRPFPKALRLVSVGVFLFAGFVFPYHFGSVEEFSFLGIGWLTNIIQSIGSSGIATAAVLGLLLDNLIPGTPEERGAIDTPVIEHPA